MTEIKQQALSKMNEEMSKPHSDVLDYIHNWFCEQEDDELFTCICKDGKSLEGAYNFMVKTAQQKKYSCISDAEGFRIMREYFLGKETDVKAVGYASTKPITKMSKDEIHAETQRIEEKVKKSTEAIIKKQEPKKETPLMNIFEFMDEPKTQAEVIAEIKAEAKANAWEDEVNEGDEVTEDEVDE